ISGNHPRIFTIADSAEALLVDWDPPEELLTTAQLVLSWLTVHLSWMPNRSIDGLRATLERWGVPDHPWARVAYTMFVEAERGDVPAGLRFFDEALTSVAPVEGLEFNGLSPWVLLAASGSLAARVRYGSTPTDRRRAVELRDLLVEQHLDHSEGGDLPYLDFP